jgi:putative transcriptional regulator
MNSLQGHFLVASPHLPDPNFYRTVVLMIQHDDSGALGVVLNRPSRRTVAEIWQMVGEGDCACNQLVHVGGPVEGPLMAVHTRKAESQTEILPGLYMTTRKDLLRRIVQGACRNRVFCGYAGWGAGQLEGELEAGGWLVCSAVIDDVFQDGETMWKKVTGRIGLEILAPTIGRHPVPDEPWWN